MGLRKWRLVAFSRTISRLRMTLAASILNRTPWNLDRMCIRIHQFNTLRITPLHPLGSTPPGGNLYFFTFLNNFRDNSNVPQPMLIKLCYNVYGCIAICHTMDQPLLFRSCYATWRQLVFFSLLNNRIYGNYKLPHGHFYVPWSSSSVVETCLIFTGRRHVSVLHLHLRPWTPDALALV